ncbi:MAG: hypothetical protein U0074_07015 [Kouleothrix sp.]
MDVADEPGDSELDLPPPGPAPSAPRGPSKPTGGIHINQANDATFTHSGNIYNGPVQFYDAVDWPFASNDALNLLIALFNDANNATQVLTANLNERTNELAYLTKQVQSGALEMSIIKSRFETALVNTRADLINFTITLRQVNGRYPTAIGAVERAINHMFDVLLPLGVRERQAVQEFSTQLLVNEQQLHFALAAIVGPRAKLYELTTLSPHFKYLNASSHEAAAEIDQFAGWARKNQQLLWRIKGMVDGLLQG